MFSVKSGVEEMNELGSPVDGRRGRRRGKGGMEKNELKEGETYSGQEDFVDPDALSYIDEKIKHVLGHFQKEFHGGASSETLGAQFGGYGSFLPSYPRFPSLLSHSKSPVKMPSHNVSRSPYNYHPKDAHHSPSVPGTTPVTKVSMSSTGNRTEISDERKENINTQSAKGIIGEQKMLRFRINVGHDNDLDRSKPDICSDMGLDISTSPSVEDSPDGCGQCSPESPDAFLESPTTILQIMTCFSVPGGYLSPLPDSLLHSNGKDEILLTKEQTEAYATSSGTSLNVKFIRSFACKKAESREKSRMPRKADESLGAMVAILKKEPQRVITTDPDISHSSRAKLGAASLERPTSSDSQKKIFGDLDNASPRNDFACNSAKENTHSNAKICLKPSFLINPLEERTENSRETSNSKEKMGSKALRNSDTTMADSCSYSGRKSLPSAQKEPVNHNSAQKSSSSTEPCTKDPNPSSPVASKRKVEMSGAPKLDKDHNKNSAIESHNGFGVSPHIQEVDDKKKHILSSSKFVDKSKEKLWLNKTDSLHITNLVALNCNSQTSDSLATISAPVLNDSWVFCDLCETWRLLPYGTNPENLPKEWQCNMQDWLTGLNKCYISEDETTKAFHELYQAPPVNASNFTAHPDTALPSISSSGTLNHNARLENNAHNAPLGGKRKHGSMKESNLPLGSYLKEKPLRSVVSHPDEGDLFGKCCKQSTSKRKLLVDVDVHTSPKKIKKDSLHHYEKDLHIEEEIASKIPINGDCNLPPKASKYFRNKPTSVKKPEDMILKNKKKHVSDFSSGEHKKYVSASNSENPGKYDSTNRERELKKSQGSGKNLIISQLISHTRPMSKDGSSESQPRRPKKTKVEKSEGQNFTATLSSSKISVSQKSRVKLQESRDSPEDSVSLSLMRILNPPNNSKNLLAKDDEDLNIGLLKGSSKSSDGHVDGCSDQSGTMTKETTSKSSLKFSITLKTADPGVLLEQSNKGRTFDQKEIHDSDHKISGKRSSQCRDGKKECTSDAQKCKHKILDSYTDLKKLDHLYPNRADNVDNNSMQHRVHDSRVVVTGMNHTEFISQENLRHASSRCRQDHSSQINVHRLEGSSENVIQTAPVSVKETNSEWCRVDAVIGNTPKSAKKLRKSTPSAIKKEGDTAIHELIQEARELKHAADHLKQEGLEHDSSGILFEASLKFLQAASLMEPPNTENVRQGELFPYLQMLQMYLETAKLCEFCACKYENSKEMAAAALAYKCAEVAYMKVAYFEQPGASKDGHDLQAALDAALLDEPPPSSPSGVHNFSNQGAFEKAALGNGTGSLQISGDLVIVAQNDHVKRLLAYTSYLNRSFEAARKSRNSIEAAGVDSKDRIREVLDCNFNNVEGLLQLELLYFTTSRNVRRGVLAHRLRCCRVTLRSRVRVLEAASCKNARK